MLKITAFEYVYLSTLDFGHLLQKLNSVDTPQSRGIFNSHNWLNQNRHDGVIAQKLLEELEENQPFGTFLNPRDEGVVLRDQIDEALGAGGKRIFTDIFLNHKAPKIFQKEEDPSALVLRADMLGSRIMVFEPFETLNKTKLRFGGASLRVFPHGVIGIEIKITFNGPSAGKAHETLETGKVIEDLKYLEDSLLRVAARQRVEKILETLKALPRWKDHTWLPRMHEQRDFDRLCATHRILVINAVTDNDEKITMTMLGAAQNAGTEERKRRDVLARELSGLLNRSKWFGNYWSGYTREITKKIIAYQDNEIFITDGGCSLSYFPEYWAGDKNKTQYIRNLVSASHYLLSWESMANYFDGYLRRVGQSNIPASEASGADLFENKLKHLSLLEHISDLLRHSVSVRSLVSHGFTRRVLAQFLNEREMGTRVNEISHQLSGFSERLRNAVAVAQHKAEYATQSWLSRIGLVVAVVSLLISAVLSVLNFFYPRSEKPTDGAGGTVSVGTHTPTPGRTALPTPSNSPTPNP